MNREHIQYCVLPSFFRHYYLFFFVHPPLTSPWARMKSKRGVYQDIERRKYSLMLKASHWWFSFHVDTNKVLTMPYVGAFCLFLFFYALGKCLPSRLSLSVSVPNFIWSLFHPMPSFEQKLLNWSNPPMMILFSSLILFL